MPKKKKQKKSRLPVHIQLQKWVDENTGLVLRLMAQTGETDRYRAAAKYLRAWEGNLEKALFLWSVGDRPEKSYWNTPLGEWPEE